MRRKSLVLLIVAATAMFGHAAFASDKGAEITADQALALLKAGNERYVEGKAAHSNQDQARRTLTSTEGQRPHTIVLSCSDSRVPVEIVMDGGIGELFIVRVAGNVTNADEAGSIEYGVEHLNSPLLLVLGHTKCGAVTAVAGKAKLEGNLKDIDRRIKPAVARAHKLHPDLKGNDFIHEAVIEDVWQSIEDLIRTSLVIRNEIRENKVTVVGAVYDIDTGKVEWMGAHPDQDRLMKKYGSKDVKKKSKKHA